MSIEQQLMEYQGKLRGKCSLSIGYDGLFAGWTATVKTEGNAFPYWQQAHGDTPGEAWDSMRGFLDGGHQLQGRGKIQASDFLQPDAELAKAAARRMMTKGV